MAPKPSSLLDTELRKLEAYDFSRPRDPKRPLSNPYESPPELDCDLVMKGGITSGVVYPLAVLELAKSHRFHAIGGTSAGAIAAVVTAAAEYGRDVVTKTEDGRDIGGFQRLIGMVKELQEPGFVANVFQPAPELRPILGLLFLVLKIKRRSKVNTEEVRTSSKKMKKPSIGSITADVIKLLASLTFAGIKLPAVLGGALGGILGALLGGGWIAAARAMADGGAALRALIWGVLVIGVFWWLGHVLGTVVWMLLHGLPRNGFGLCDGLPVKGHERHRFVKTGDKNKYGHEPSAALTEWLTMTIDEIAGVQDGPLTFRHLEYNHEKEIKPERKITLNTVTTNVSQGQPYILPFSGRQYLFSKQEWLKLFPEPVVNHLTDPEIAYTPRNLDLSQPILDEYGNEHNLFFLPTDPRELPVVVAARMSLSFPILLSAVPLWTISNMMFDGIHGEGSNNHLHVITAKDVRRNWFSDGGICSNFPIHFYDRLFPTHPTFGINLGDEPVPLYQKGRGMPDEPVPVEPDPQWELPTDLLKNGNGQVLPRLLRKPCDVGEINSFSLPSSYPEDRPGPSWAQIDRGLPGFVGAIVNTGLFYRDILQSRLPSYYDRTITVNLKDSEGGMNLDMPTATLATIALKGQQAGGALTKCFDFDHHRWVRFRLLLSQLEQQMIELRRPMMGDRPRLKPDLLQAQLESISKFLSCNGININTVQKLMILQEQSSNGNDLTKRFPFPFPTDKEWSDAALPRLYALLLMIEVWGGNENALFQLNDSIIPSEQVNDDLDQIRLRVTPEL